jgi:hypothetical protein
MAEHLTRLQDEAEELRLRLEKATARVGKFTAEASALANDAARLLINEFLDWRVVLLDRPLQPVA